ncbi:MAG: alpha/beta fold hydrolase [Solirubrobacteraceae bacterium]
MSAHAFYLNTGSASAYALFDDTQARVDRVGVLLCPLYGNDDLCSYRARRHWAKRLAAAGHPTLRIDLPGTGDSGGGPYDSGLLNAWTDALATAGGWLRVEADCARVVAIGVGLGGLLAYRALTDGAPIDDLVLWSVPARGRTWVRQLRALSQMEASRETVAENDPDSLDQPDPLPEGALASAGFVMSGETVTAVEAIDLTELALPDASSRRILLLERDGLEVDRRLRAALEQSGAEVAVGPGPGYGAMVAPPQQSHAPLEVIESVRRWLTGCPTIAATKASLNAIATTTELELTVHDRTIRELPIALSLDDGELVGVLSEAAGAAEVCAVMLNAGALRHIGPNRMWVELARRWATQGVPTLRIDLTGIGDSDGDASTLEQDEGFYLDRYVEQTNEVLAALVARGLPERFVLAGLCSGAYWALHAALVDERVRGAFMINPRALFWHPNIEGFREARNVRKALRWQTWRKLARGQIERERIETIAGGVGVALRSLPERLHAYRRGRASGSDELGGALDRLQQTGAQLLGVFTVGEPVFEELERDGGLARAQARPNVRIESIPGPLTSHTLEPVVLQQAVHTLLDDALGRLLAKNADVTRDAASPSSQMRLNEKLWANSDLVAHYTDRSLRPPEALLLERYGQELSGRVLELGCGAGRLSSHLLDSAGEFRGLDISQSMIAYCRRAYPAGRFEQGDLRELSRYETASFDVVFAPFNVLDVLDDAERRRVLREIRRILAEQGLLMMSTHNLAHAPHIPKPTHLGSRRNPVRVTRELLRIPRRIRNWRRARPLQSRMGDHAILVDEAHDYSILHYYIGRDAQRRQLAELGFELLECLDLDGGPVEPGEDAALCAELHYVARPTPDAEAVHKSQNMSL